MAQRSQTHVALVRKLRCSGVSEKEVEEAVDQTLRSQIAILKAQRDDLLERLRVIEQLTRGTSSTHVHRIAADAVEVPA